MMFLKTMKEYTAKTEGGYVNNKNDRGGETYKGVSRTSNPNWRGWPIIDVNKAQLKAKGLSITNKIMNKTLGEIADLDNAVLDVYRKNYWRPYDTLELPSQIQSKLFDMGVNIGVGRTIKMFQRVLLDLGADLGGSKADGIIGAKTITASKKTIKNDKSSIDIIINKLINLQTVHYKQFVKAQRYWKKYLQAFLTRAKFRGVTND